MNKIATAFATCLLALPALSPAGLAQSSDTKPPEKLPGLNPAFIDKNADPCQDFFQYACGNFSKLHPLPPDRSNFGTITLLQEYNDSILHNILDKTSANNPSRTPNEQKIGDFYASCLDTAAIDRAGLRPLQPELNRIAALKTKDELTALLAHDQLIGVNALLSFGEQQDFADARKQIAAVDQGGLGMPERDFYLRTGDTDKQLREKYVEHIANTLRLLGESDTQANTDAQKVMEIETALAKASLDITSERDPKNIYHITKVADLEAMTPAIHWKQFLSDTGTPPVTDLNVTYPPFFKALNQVIESTDLETLKIYMRWQLIHSTPGIALPTALDEEDFNFAGKVLRGQQQQRARWRRCVQATDGALGEALGQVYAAEVFPPSSKTATVQMVKDIEAAMSEDIDSLDWMSAATKIKAKEKLHAVANKIGYPDKWRDYSSLKIVRGDVLGNAVRASQFENERQIAKIGKPVDRGEFDMSPPTVNAYYSPNMNDINFPAGILQPPFYDPDSPDAVNYGHIGGIVGHELTHGFDDQGRQFDANGNLSDWWTEDDGKKFDQKTDCEVKEYGDFTVTGGYKVNGKLTLGENTADNGGIRLAYIAFLADAKRKSIDLNAKQDGYTPLQQFFLAQAQTWCGETRPESERLQVQTDFHAPRQFRVNGVVRNMSEFSNAFGCKAGQPMDPGPAQACRVW